MVINETSINCNKSKQQQQVSNAHLDTTITYDEASKQQQQQQRKTSKPLIITEKLLNDTSNLQIMPQMPSINKQQQNYDDESDVDEPIDNELTEEDIEFITANTEFTNEQIQNWYADFLAKCTNGVISKNQFCTYYKTLMPSNLNDTAKKDLSNKLFHLFDIDGDDNLNYAEFLVSFWIRCQAPIKEKFLWLFNAYDSDKNGVLDYYEIRNALKCCFDIDILDQLLEQLNHENINYLMNKKYLLQTSMSSPTIASLPGLCYPSPIGSITTTPSTPPILIPSQLVPLPLTSIIPTNTETANTTTSMKNNTSISSSTSSAMDDDDEAFYDDNSARSSKSNLNSSFTDTQQKQETIQQQLQLQQQAFFNHYLLQQQQQQYNIYSRTTNLINDKLHELIIQLDRISKLMTANNENILTSTTSSTSIPNDIQQHYLPFNIKNILISRKSFVNLCVKYKLLRKLLVPIDYYYEEYEN